MMGTGVAGVLFGSKAADLLERVLGPLTARDGTGFLSLFPVGRFRMEKDGDNRLGRNGSPPGAAQPTDAQERLANRRSERWFRVFNETSVLLFTAIVVLVVVKPF